MSADQLSMLHRLPSARVVDRLTFLVDIARGRRVIHIGFADAGYVEMQEGANAWLHARLATVTSSLVGLDVDAEGVEAARRRGYEAYSVDCRSSSDIAALDVAPAEVVLAGEVIEHLDQPGPFLDAMHELVAPAGRLVLTTPNASGLGNSLLALAGLEINHPDHVVLFSWQTLSALLERHGWKAISAATYIPAVKPLADPTPRARMLAAGGRGLLGLERALGKLGAPFVADGLIIVASSAVT